MNKYKKTIIAVIKGEGREPICTDWENWLKDRHPELFEEEFKVGDWVYWSGNCQTVGKIKAHAKPIIGLCFELSETHKDTKYDSCHVDNLRKATSEEIETHLIKEAKKRGYFENSHLHIEEIRSPVKNLKYNPNWSPDMDCLYDTETLHVIWRPDKGWMSLVETITKEEAEKQLGKKIV